MNRVLKILGLTVGILLVLILPILGYFLIDKKSSWEYPAYDERLIIGEVIDFEFIGNNSQVFLTYVKRDGLRDEHKHKRFAKHHIKNETLIEFVDLHRKILELGKS